MLTGGKRKAENPSDALILETNADLESDAQELRHLQGVDMVNSIAALRLHPDTQFLIDSSLAQGLIRGVQMITLHQHSGLPPTSIV